MSAAVILAELRTGPKTTSELRAVTGTTSNAVLCGIYQLGRAGHHVVNDTPQGGGEGLYRLASDLGAADRTCHWPGCGERLNSYNPGPYCLAHRSALARMVLESFDACLDRIEEVTDEPLELFAPVAL